MISLSVCNSAVAGMLISFGTVLGRLMPSQILFMSVFACFFFTLNQTIVSNILRAVDVGGSISVHIFGAYFGLALSWVLGKTYSLQGINSTVNYHSTMFSMLGTLFLWMFWPSANSGSIYWGSPHDQEIRLWTIINTLLSLTGSCIATFSMSMFFKGKIHMADVLNASLAGGVAIGSCCSIMQNSSWALVIGLIAGFISSLGFAKIGPWLSRKGLIDVCGVFNLHAMPGLFGGIAGAIVFAIYTVSAPSIVVNPSSGYDYSKQAGMQIAGTFISLGIALITGAACGLILCYFENIPAYDFFEDKVFFNIDIAEAEKRGKSDSIPNNESNMMQSSMVELKKISLDPNFC
jgi:ammonium transporter Rh